MGARLGQQSPEFCFLLFDISGKGKNLGHFDNKTATITLNPHHRSILILRMFLYEQEKEKIL